METMYTLKAFYDIIYSRFYVKILPCVGDVGSCVTLHIAAAGRSILRIVLHIPQASRWWGPEYTHVSHILGEGMCGGSAIGGTRSQRLRTLRFVTRATDDLLGSNRGDEAQNCVTDDPCMEVLGLTYLCTRDTITASDY